jgi:hypothetical protein
LYAHRQCYCHTWQCENDVAQPPQSLEFFLKKTFDNGSKSFRRILLHGEEKRVDIVNVEKRVGIVNVEKRVGIVYVNTVKTFFYNHWH